MSRVENYFLSWRRGEELEVEICAAKRGPQDFAPGGRNSDKIEVIYKQKRPTTGKRVSLRLESLRHVPRCVCVCVRERERARERERER